MIVDKILQVALREATARPTTTRLTASNVGKCVRAGWYAHHGIPQEPLPPRTMLVFSLGNLVEDSLCKFIEKATEDFIRTDAWRDTTTEPETGLRARSDFMFALDDQPLWPNELGERVCVPGQPLPPQPGEMLGGEIKSMSNFGFERALRGKIDEAYRAQVEVCLRAYGLRWWLVVAYRKETSNICEILVGRDDDVWASVVAKVDAARGEATPERPYALDSACKGTADGTCVEGKTPKTGRAHKRCGGTGLEPGGPFVPNFPCGYCSWRAECWGQQELVFRDGKPVWRLA